jgi:hypothetical protein
MLPLHVFVPVTIHVFAILHLSLSLFFTIALNAVGPSSYCTRRVLRVESAGLFSTHAAVASVKDTILHMPRRYLLPILLAAPFDMHADFWHPRTGASHFPLSARSHVLSPNDARAEHCSAAIPTLCFSVVCLALFSCALALQHG